ncbi:hypothetical protein C1645_790245 [Glomus cerebriforme]|uniref:Uncharacterized protein n=1 Tax=Glomus cerebriforme TaxID=658196 RepID=A0A397S561_9GLOM|nr:hypothetical protein C1645_790245 [Glomus cerebriforme]
MKFYYENLTVLFLHLKIGFLVYLRVYVYLMVVQSFFAELVKLMMIYQLVILILIVHWEKVIEHTSLYF